MTPDLSLQRLGPYNLVKQLGGNGMVTTFKGMNPDTMDAVAIVAIAQSDIIEKSAWDYFTQIFPPLMKAPASRLAQPRQFAAEGNVFWAAFEYLEGSHVGQRAQTDGLPTPAQALDWMSQVADALSTLNGYGLAHRFLSPASVFVNDIGRVKLLHAGWGGLLLYAKGGMANPVFMSVLPFLAPEIINGDVGDVSSDVYSIGAMLYYLITGVPPFWADDPLSLIDLVGNSGVDFHALTPYVTPPVVELIAEMLSRNPEDRPVNLPALTERLSMMMSGELYQAMQPEGDSYDQGPISRDNQNYSSRGRAYEGLGEESTYQDTNMEGVAYPPDDPTGRFGGGDQSAGYGDPSGPPPGTFQDEYDSGVMPPKARDVGGSHIPRLPDPTPHPSAQKSGSSSKLPAYVTQAGAGGAYGTATTPPPPTAAPSSSKNSGRNTKVLVIGAVALVLFLAVAAGAVVMLRKSGDKKKTETTAPVVTAAEIARRKEEQQIKDYTVSLERMWRVAKSVRRYRTQFGAWPKALVELAEVGAVAADFRDVWGEDLDLRASFIVSAGEDRQWESNDDFWIDCEKDALGGFTPTFTLPEDSPLVISYRAASAPAK